MARWMELDSTTLRGTQIIRWKVLCVYRSMILRSTGREIKLL